MSHLESVRYCCTRRQVSAYIRCIGITQSADDCAVQTASRWIWFCARSAANIDDAKKAAEYWACEQLLERLRKLARRLGCNRRDWAERQLDAAQSWTDLIAVWVEMRMDPALAWWRSARAPVCPVVWGVWTSGGTVDVDGFLSLPPAIDAGDDERDDAMRTRRRPKEAA